MERVHNPYYGISDSELIALGNRAIWVAAVGDAVLHLDALRGEVDIDDGGVTGAANRGEDGSEWPVEDPDELIEFTLEEGDEGFLPDLNLDTGSPLCVAHEVVQAEHERLVDELGLDVLRWLAREPGRRGVLWGEVIGPWRESGKGWKEGTPTWVRALGSESILDACSPHQ